MRMLRKRYISSEVAANFIKILKSTPADNLLAPCGVDHFNNKQRLTLDLVSPLLS